MTMASTKKVFHVMYDDDGKLMDAAKKLVAQGIQIKDVFSPFPVHGIDPVIGVKRTRLAIASFMYAMTGTSLALFGMWYFMIQDWPMNIGGKPSFSLIQNLPAFVVLKHNLHLQHLGLLLARLHTVEASGACAVGTALALETHLDQQGRKDPAHKSSRMAAQ